MLDVESLLDVYDTNDFKLPGFEFNWLIVLILILHQPYFSWPKSWFLPAHLGPGSTSWCPTPGGRPCGPPRSRRTRRSWRCGSRWPTRHSGGSSARGVLDHQSLHCPEVKGYEYVRGYFYSYERNVANLCFYVVTSWNGCKVIKTITPNIIECPDFTILVHVRTLTEWIRRGKIIDKII